MRTPIGTELIFHDPAASGAISPFEEAMRHVLAGGTGDIACPFIGLKLLSPFLSRLDRWRILTDVCAWMSIVPREPPRRALVQWLVEQGSRVRHVTNLHAKVVLGRDSALVASANLTEMGTRGRVEMGVLIHDNEHVATLRRWFDQVWQAATELDEMTLVRLGASSPVAAPGRYLLDRELTARLGPSPVVARGVVADEGDTDGTGGIAATTEDVDDGRAPLASLLRLRVSRAWAEAFLSWLQDLIELTGLPEGDRQLTTTLTDGGRSLGVNVNNRSALSWHRGRWNSEPRVYYLLPRDFAERLAHEHPADVARLHCLHKDGIDPDPPALLVADFPPPATFGDPETFRQRWRQAITYELGRKRGHSPRGQGRHLPLLYRLGSDAELRRRFLDDVYA